MSEKRSSRSGTIQASWYDFPQYYDLAFRSETALEADFIEAACRKYCDFPVRRLLEPACGSGRLVVEMARRGYRVTGFDLSRAAIGYLRRKLKRRGLRARVLLAHMAAFRLPERFDAAYNTFDSFRHLVPAEQARNHLQQVANCLRPGGIYILGFHLLPPDASTQCIERWTERWGRLRATVTLRVVATNRRLRREHIRISLLVRSGRRVLRIRDEFRLRIYTASQFLELLAGVPDWQLCDVYDFWYEIDRPVPLDDRISDAVFILKKRLQV
jgi:SAM-dependent methyltransferase